MKVKVCGITSIADGLKAVESGADALGFVLAESPRKITYDELKKMASSIPIFVNRVGVFVNEKASLVRKLLEEGFIDYAQLHGDEDIRYCESLPLRKVIKAIRPRNLKDIEDASVFKNTAAILIDSFTAEKKGGTGKTCDWGLACEAKRIGPPIILSGGLNIRNVREAVERVMPYAVDVASGVEKSPGKKDYNLLEIFIRSAKEI